MAVASLPVQANRATKRGSRDHLTRKATIMSCGNDRKTLWCKTATAADGRDGGARVDPIGLDAAPLDKVGFDAAAFVRLARSRFPSNTAAHLAAMARATHSTAEKWLAKETKPNADALSHLLAGFGTALLPVLARGVNWTDELTRADRRARLEAELAALDGKPPAEEVR
ncbi:MAG: hypothetical protein AAF764_00750 [Pseudomonadota bacterium]